MMRVCLTDLALPWRALESLSCKIDPVHGVTPGNRLEVWQRRADGEREVLSAARRDSHVLSEDGFALCSGGTATR